MNSFDEHFSEAWLAEEVFAQLKDFKIEPPKEEENIESSNSNDALVIDEDYSSNNALDSPAAPNKKENQEFQHELEEETNEILTNSADAGPIDEDLSSNNLQDLGLPPPDKEENNEQELENVDSNLDQQLNIPEIDGANVEKFESQDSDSLKYLEPSFFTEENIVECANCSCMFDGASFIQHICDYDEDKKLIIVEPITTISASTAPAEPACIRLLRENQIRIRRFLKEELKYDVNARIATNQKHDGPHECNLCERKFVHASGLSRHMEKHAMDQIPTSSSASNAFPPINCLKVVIKCTICGRIFFETVTAFEHLDVHFPVKKEDELNISPKSTPFTSAPGFSYEKYLDEALIFLKNESESFDNKPVNYFKIVILSCVLQCEFCDFVFSEVSYLLAHSACHQPQKPFECNACEVHVATSKQIFMHWQAECVFARENLKRGFSSQQYYVCNVCENKFGSLEQLHEHRYTAYHFFPRMHEERGVLMLPCEYCDQVFATAKDIVYHFEERHCKKNKREPSKKDRQYLCDICGKTYTQSSHLWQHLRFHKGVKPFACNLPGCSRRFTIRPDLNDHIRKCHTGERPYHCLLCGRRFLTGSVFYQHRLIHRGERRYGCDDCGKRFYRADALKNHQRIHTGEKPFGCLFCTKSFRQKGDCDKHIRARHSQLDANSRIMMQMRKMQLEAAEKANADPSSSDPADVFMVGNVLLPKSMFQPLLNDIDADQD